MPAMDDWTPIRDWLVTTAIGRATEVVPVPGGIAVVAREVPLAHDHNRLLITQPASAADLMQAADEILGGRGMNHRRIAVLDEQLARSVAPELSAAGYRPEHEVIMTFSGAPAASPADRADRIVVVGLDERVLLGTQGWQVSNPEMSEETTRQLGERMRTMVGVADTEFFAVHAADGTVIAHADLYWRDGIAQIEDVETLPAARNQGHASALVRVAAGHGAGLGNRMILLVADADDWPQQLYRRLGFTDTARTVAFSRS